MNTAKQIIESMENNSHMLHDLLILNPTDQQITLGLLKELELESNITDIERQSIAYAKRQILSTILKQVSITNKTLLGNTVVIPEEIAAKVEKALAEAIPQLPANEKEGKVIKMIPNTTQEAVEHTVPEKKSKERVDIPVATIDPVFDMIQLSQIRVLGQLESALRNYRNRPDVTTKGLKNVYFSCIKNGNLEGVTENLYCSLDGLTKRFEAMVINFKEKVTKKPINVVTRLSITDVEAHIKSLAETKDYTAIDAYATEQFRKKGVLTTDGKVIPTKSKEDLNKYLLSIVPEYAAPWIEETAIAEYKNSKVGVVKQDIMDKLNDPSWGFGSFLQRLQICFWDYKIGDLEQGKADATATAIEIFTKNELFEETIQLSTGIYQTTKRKLTEEEVYKILAEMQAKSNFKWVYKTDVDKLFGCIIQEVADKCTEFGNNGEGVKTTIDTILEEKGVNNIPSSKKVSIFKQAKEIIKSKIFNNPNPITNPVVVDAQTEIAKEESIINTDKATVFIRFDVAVVNPELFNKHSNNLKNLHQLKKACNEILQKTDWVTSLNFALDSIIVLKKIADLKTDKEDAVKQWFYTTIIPDLYKEFTDSIKKEDVVAQAEELANSSEVEAITEAEVIESKVPYIPSNEKELMEYCVNLIKEGKEDIAKEAMYAFPSWAKKNEEFFVARLKKYQNKAK